MSNEKSAIWWTYDHAPTRWAIVGSFVAAWFFTIVFLFSDVWKVLAARPWWEDLIVAFPLGSLPP
jgi:hypothetical protein